MQSDIDQIQIDEYFVWTDLYKAAINSTWTSVTLSDSNSSDQWKHDEPDVGYAYAYISSKSKK